MAGTVTQSGTWTTAPFDTALLARTKPNTPQIGALALTESAGVPDEIRQIVQAVADGWNISHWGAAAVLRKLLQAYMDEGAPTPQ